MLDIKYIREHSAEVQQNAKQRNVKVNVDKIIELDELIRNHKQIADSLRTKRNTLADKQKKLKGKDKGLIEEGKSIKKELSNVEAELEKYQAEFDELLSALPNVTHPEVPIGASDEDNKELRVVGEPTKFDFTPKDHVELAAQHDLLDFERAADVAGSGFYFVKNEGVLLELALIQYALQIARSHGYAPMIPPDVAYQEILNGTGYNPRGNETQIYSLENTDLSLIATAEIGIAGYHKNHTFSQEELAVPKKYVGLSHCFRTEAGSYGRESHGLYRVHQFTKVELFIFCKPEQSEELHQELLAIEEEIMAGLEIPYRVVDICTGDLGGPAYRKYDIEAWMPFRNDWGEVTSASNCTDYQARRLGIKYKNEKNKNDLVHTLNGTAVALSRIPICILENHQQKDGVIQIPAVLQPYMAGIQTIG